MTYKLATTQTLRLSVLCAALAALTISSCKKEDDDPIDEPQITEIEGCTDAAALNYNADATTDDGSCTYSSTPQITIVKPTSEAEPISGNRLHLYIKYEDDVELTSTEIKITSSITGGSAYVDQERGLEGTSDAVDIFLDLPEFNLLGNHLLTVKAVNEQGNEEVVDFDFTIVDRTEAGITINEVFAQSPFSPGTPFSRFDFEVDDNYALASVKREILAVDQNGEEYDTYYSETVNITEFTSEYALADDFYLNYGPEGANYRARITVEDADGNVAVWESQTMQL